MPSTLFSDEERSSQLYELLDRIEDLETQSLSWGFADGSLSETDLIDIARDVANADDAETLIAALLDAALLYEVRAADGSVRYRSRYAETARLLVRLRQLFPGKQWLAGPRLVADFRIDRRRRRYAIRNIFPDKALSQIKAENASFHGLQENSWNALTSELILAGFQVRACERVVSSKGNESTIITAGTGSGKTLAFYIPAFLRIAAAVEKNAWWVKALAIYPRTELLKDQFAEAYKRARLLDDTLTAENKRPLLLGTLFGYTPRNAEDVPEKWRRHHGAPYGYVCPLMKCPMPTCSGELIWLEEDRKVGKERLVCSSQGCDSVVTEDHITLTRAALLRRAPDLLFTTTEMLNQRLSDTRMHRLFGIGAYARKPLLVLLDEVHTYMGTSGAQAALVLRRYRSALNCDLPFVGLSATLAEASRFFSELVGVPVEAVHEISPLESEIREKSSEYQLLLRSDPSAQVLSTSIQVAMLLGRSMDPALNGRSEGRFGSRVFVFTDDLDVTNRLFDYLREAEAYTIFGKPDVNKVPLAALRGDGPDAQAKDLDGQRWRMCEEIGRPLSTRLKVTRTTSQDAGVNSESDVIVATSSLEVGYNDPLVGAVLQHKAPRDAASFLQRRGRAGRPLDMRPLSVTVLSDYGRDRVAFQAFEHLFNPMLPVQVLPVQNDYILRIQAVYSFIDWLAFRLPKGSEGWLWDALSRCTGSNAGLRRHVQHTLEALLELDPSTVEDLRQWLVGGLQVDGFTVEAILWEPPRALLLEAIPTLLRRLLRNWKRVDGVGEDVRVDWHPLPDFIPRNLFGDLSLPEVRVVLPPATSHHEERVEAIPIARALAQLAPGKVTRRFAPERGALSHWFPIDLDLSEQQLPIKRYCEESEYLGIFGEAEPLPTYRPWQIRLEQIKSRDVLPSSNAFPVWQTQLLPHGDPLIVEVPSRNAWRRLVIDIRFYLHRFRASVLVRRYATVVNANLHRRTGSQNVQISFCGDEGEAAAVGHEFEADGFYVDVILPSAKQLEASALPPRLLASCRSAYFRHRVMSDAKLPRDAGPFHREWLCQLLVSAAIVRAASSAETLGVAANAVAQDPAKLQEVMDTVFAIPQPMPPANEEGDDAEGDENDGDDASGSAGAHNQGSRLYRSLSDLINREEVRRRLSDLSRELDVPDPLAWGAWLQGTLLESIGEGVLQACIATAPRHTSTDTLVLDVESETDGLARIWITESTIGGAGVVQAFADAFSLEPRALFVAIEAALAPTDYELAADGMERYLRAAALHPEVATAADELRGTLGHVERAAKREELLTILARKGLDVPRVLAVSLDARVFRPGSGRHVEQTLLRMMTRWDELEARFGIAIGLREMAYVAATDPKITALVREIIRRAAPAAHQSRANLAQVIASLLWPRGVEIRQRALQSYNPFRARRLTDPALVRSLLLDQQMPDVAVNDPDWQSKLRETMAECGASRLTADADGAAALRLAIIQSLTIPIEVGFLRFYPTVERIERTDGRLVAMLSLRELF